MPSFYLFDSFYRVSGHNGPVFDRNLVYCEFWKLEKVAGKRVKLKWSDLKFGAIEQYLHKFQGILLHKIKKYCSTHKGRASGILLHHHSLVDFPNEFFFPAHCTEVRFASLLSGGFTTKTVINPPDWKLANRTFVQCELIK